MQNRKKVLILASILLAACATDPIQESTDTVVTPEETVAAKICNTSQSAIKGMIIAKFNDEVIPVLEQAVAQQAATRSQVLEISQIFRAKVVDVSPEATILELTGKPMKLDGFVTMLMPYGVMELARTGVTSISRGKSTIKDETDYKEKI